MNHISGVNVSVPALRAVDREFEPRWSQIKDYQITASPRKYWLARNQDDVWGDMSTRDLPFQPVT